MRARQTIEEVFQSLDEDVTGVQYMDTLYTFDHRALLDWLSERHEQELTIVGHNPALHDIIEWFSTNSLPKFPTAAYCKLTLSIDNWREFSRGSGKVEVLLTAKGLRESLSG